MQEVLMMHIDDDYLAAQYLFEDMASRLSAQLRSPHTVSGDILPLLLHSSLSLLYENMPALTQLTGDYNTHLASTFVPLRLDFAAIGAT